MPDEQVRSDDRHSRAQPWFQPDAAGGARGPFDARCGLSNAGRSGDGWRCAASFRATGRARCPDTDARPLFRQHSATDACPYDVGPQQTGNRDACGNDRARHHRLHSARQPDERGDRPENRARRAFRPRCRNGDGRARQHGPRFARPADHDMGDRNIRAEGRAFGRDCRGADRTEGLAGPQQPAGAFGTGALPRKPAGRRGAGGFRPDTARDDRGHDRAVASHGGDGQGR